MLRRSFAAGLSLFAAFPLSVFAQSDAEKKFDLIIIGIGVAGLSTAVSAAQSGVKNTLLIDKAAFVGGHSALSGGLSQCSRSGSSNEAGHQRQP